MITITTTEPGFIGDLSSEVDDEIVEKYEGEFKNKLSHKPKVYIHGELARWAGYDVPVFLSGIIEDVPEQKARVVHPNTYEVRECLLIIGKEYGYFLTEEKAKELDRSILDGSNW